MMNVMTDLFKVGFQSGQLLTTRTNIAIEANQIGNGRKLLLNVTTQFSNNGIL